MKKDKGGIALHNTATINTDVNEQGVLTIKVEGRLDSTTTGDVWLKATKVLEQTSATKVIVDAAKIDYCDGSGVGSGICAQHFTKVIPRELLIVDIDRWQ